MRTAADNLAPTFGREVRVPLPIDASRPARRCPARRCHDAGSRWSARRGQSLLREQRRRLQSMAAAEGRDANELEAELRAKARSGACSRCRMPRARVAESRRRDATRACARVRERASGEHTRGTFLACCGRGRCSRTT